MVERLVDAKRAFDAAQERSDEVGRRIAGNGGAIPPAELGELHAEVARLAEELAAALDDLDELGILVKDLDTGLVDFPVGARRRAGPALLAARRGRDRLVPRPRRRLRGQAAVMRRRN